MTFLLSLYVVFCFQGEVCVASSRVYVQEGIYDELVKKLVEKAKAWIVGDPFDPKVQQGPQVWSEPFKDCLAGYKETKLIGKNRHERNIDFKNEDP